VHFEEYRIDDGANAEYDGNIRDIKYRPYTKIEEVYDMTKTYAVDQIAKGAADKKRRAVAKHRTLAANIRKETDAKKDDGDPHDDKKRALMGKDAKSGAGIQNERDMKNILYDGKGHPRKHFMSNNEFYELIQNDDTDTQKNRHENASSLSIWRNLCLPRL